LEDSYKAISRFEQSVGQIVTEPIKSHVIKVINSRDRLIVITSDAQRSYQYQMFQLIGKQQKWLFTIKTLYVINDQSFLSELDQMINSIKLVPGGFPRASN